ncbi:MAG: polyhydroxybutyrate depolymerase [Actinomycetota bacterium]|jgi:polyhydroxybutyrate depolymerase|nr:polyhydroxybutyrate depolymerase [Actinomycetota bacterium]
MSALPRALTQRGEVSQARRVLALIAVLALGLLVVPASATPSGASATIATEYAGKVRSFNYYVAPRVPTRTPVPLLIVLHGLYLDPGTAEASSGMDAIADSQDVALAYPAGLNGSWNAGICCGDAHAQHLDDVGFLIHVVQLVAQLRPIDLDRVYLAGFSNGGMMALKAVCDRPDVFAAAVSMSGTLQTPCQGRRPVSALMLHGLQDTTIPYAGQRHSSFLGTPITPVPTSAARLAARSACVDNLLQKARRYSTKVYVGCAESTSVQLITAPALGHRWPTKAHDGIDGGGIAWAFLSAHRRLG